MLSKDKAMVFEELSAQHTQSLYQFEHDNRAWFETLISSRGEDFYAEGGVAQHIAKAMAEAGTGRSFAGLLLDSSHVVARGNLKDFSADGRSCFVGYRVASAYAGQGWATVCLAELLKIAETRFGVIECRARVLDNNPASAAVLQKNGFKPIAREDNYLEFNGQMLASTIFSRSSL